MLKNHLQLSENDRNHLQILVRQEKVSRKVFQRASALLELDSGSTLQQAAARAGVNYNAVAAWRRSRSGPVRVARSALTADNAPKLRLWRVPRHPKAMPAGACTCWRIRRWSWAMSKPFRIIMSKPYSKKRVAAAPQKDLVLDQTR
jgi:hypothetical protein